MTGFFPGWEERVRAAHAAFLETVATTSDDDIAVDARGHRLRHDGWTPVRQRDFLHYLAEGETVEAACARIGLSVSSAYQLRRRAEGAAFALGWRAALLVARDRLLDRCMRHAVEGVVHTTTDPDGNVTTRHRDDPNLMLRLVERLDARAAADGTATRIAQEFDAYCAHLAAGPTPADAHRFLAARSARVLAPGAALVAAARFADTADTLPPPPPEPVPAPPSEETEDPEDDPVWWCDEAEDWRTRFPPPPGFAGYQSEPSDYWAYERALSPAEAALVARDPDRQPEEEADDEADEAERDAWFAALADRIDAQERTDDDAPDPDETADDAPRVAVDAGDATDERNIREAEDESTLRPPADAGYATGERTTGDPAERHRFHGIASDATGEAGTRNASNETASRADAEAEDAADERAFRSTTDTGGATDERDTRDTVNESAPHAAAKAGNAADERAFRPATDAGGATEKRHTPDAADESAPRAAAKAGDASGERATRNAVDGHRCGTVDDRRMHGTAAVPLPPSHASPPAPGPSPLLPCATALRRPHPYEPDSTPAAAAPHAFGRALPDGPGGARPHATGDARPPAYDDALPPMPGRAHPHAHAPQPPPPPAPS